MAVRVGVPVAVCVGVRVTVPVRVRVRVGVSVRVAVRVGVSVGILQLPSVQAVPLGHSALQMQILGSPPPMQLPLPSHRSGDVNMLESSHWVSHATGWWMQVL